MVLVLQRRMVLHCSRFERSLFSTHSATQKFKAVFLILSFRKVRFTMFSSRTFEFEVRQQFNNESDV